ncbi:MAG: hypothetical protein CVV64_09640 [Candidatus Wallbacteria bacterium HGW-Wallbacteria-1]|jgi:O-antigen ligase|uniref:O-antigen ligase-related domain-containing protein n=1 Tax=Candidatus Wallbacteria bacterium HGW-Wallbacteria-1 TaxID=2013854 RepID=A0A2N1PQK4_9BACT|nr:MAG: hypothetical protein CVV64_09640 [Candidatus Wallbacteria bacterium HGW-Wallbacteria-1]
MAIKRRYRNFFETTDILASLIIIVAIVLWCYMVSVMVVNLDPRKIFLVIFSIIIFLVVIVHPEFGFGLIVFISPIYNPYIREVKISGALANNLLFIMALIAFVAKKLIHKDRSIVHTNLDFPVFSLIIWMVMIMYQTTNFAMAFKKFFGLLLFLLPIFVTINIVTNRKIFAKLLDIISFSTILGALYGIYTAVFEPFGGSIYRAYGAFVNPNELGNYLLITIPLILSYSLSLGSSFKRMVLLGGNSILFLALLATKSRGAWIGVGFGLVFLSLYHRQRIVIMLLISITVITLFSVPQLSDKVMAINFNTNSFMARYVLWFEAIKTIREHPFTGVGFGNWLRIPIPYNAKTFDNAFNMFLTAGAEMGIIGMLLLAWVLLAPFFKGIKLVMKLEDQFWRHVIMGLTASILASLVHGMVEDPVYMIFTNWMLGICLGLVYAASEIINAESQAAQEKLANEAGAVETESEFNRVDKSSGYRNKNGNGYVSDVRGGRKYTHRVIPKRPDGSRDPVFFK